MTYFNKITSYPKELESRFNSFITTQFDDSMSVEMQLRSLIKWITSTIDLVNNMVDYLNMFIERFDEQLQKQIAERLNQWLDDGTLAEIINKDVFDMKIDREEFEDYQEEVQTQLRELEVLVTNILDERLGIIDKELEERSTKIVNINAFPRFDGEETDDNRIQRALDSLPINEENYDSNRPHLFPLRSGKLALDGEDYVITRPIVLKAYQTIEGVRGRTVIKKIGHQTIPQHPYDSIIGLVDSDFGITKSTYGVGIKNLILKGNNYTEYGIHLNNASHIDIDNVTIHEVRNGVYGLDVWLSKYERVTVRNYNEKGNVGFHIEGGTSNLFNNTYSFNFRGGYNLGSTHYSVLNACACDAFNDYAYTRGQAVVYNGCGAEGGRLPAGAFVFGIIARSATINACQILNIQPLEGVGRGQTSLFNTNGSRLTVNNFRELGTSGLIDLFHSASDSKVEVVNSGFSPDNYNDFAKITHRFGSVVETYGERKRYYYYEDGETKMKETVRGVELLRGQAKTGNHKGIAIETGVNIQPSDVLFENTYLAKSNESISILEIVNYASNFTFGVHMDIYINKGTDGTELKKAYTSIVNGTKNTPSVSSVHGDIVNSVNVYWNGERLVVHLNESFANCFIVVKVSQYQSNGLATFKWL